VSNISRGKLTVVAPGQEELPLNSRDQARIAALLADDSNEAESPEKSKKKKEEDAFCSMDPKELKTASTYTYYWGQKDEQSLEWKILPDAVWLQDPNDPLEFPESMELQENSIKEDELEDPATVFFKYIYPNIVGKFLTMLTLLFYCKLSSLTFLPIFHYLLL
jgi:hypothetical protein